MNDYLISRGWRLVAVRKTHDGGYQCWTHPDHQPVARGWFTADSAERHQRMLDQGGQCNCVPQAQHGPVRVVRLVGV